MKHKITVIGLGPGSKEFLTMGVLEKLKTGNNIVLRTEKHPVVDYLNEIDIRYTSFDNLYEEMESFDKVYSTIADRLLTMVEEKDVIYAVPGSPFVAEYSVQILQKKAEERSIEVDFISGASFLEAILHTLKIDPVNGLQVLDGLRLDEQVLDPQKNTIITQVYDKMIASEVKIRLMDYFHDEQPIVIIKGAGIPSIERIENIKLYELDHIEWIDHLTSVYIPKVDKTNVKYYNMNNLINIMEKLRYKDGCPWDRKQTHNSLKPYLIEEAYEVLEALETNDMELLEEELGDLLLQIVFHAQLATESNIFNMSDVTTGICKKLIYRHPHVFKDVKADSEASALASWETMKKKEKDEKTYTEGLKRIPKQLPALMKSYKIQGKAANIGFDWDHVEGAIDKVKEELDELLEVYLVDKDKATEELGDLLFAVVNVSRFLKIQPEFALNKTIEKFINRFEFIEKSAKKEGKDMEALSLEEMDEYWNLAKIHKNIKKYK